MAETAHQIVRASYLPISLVIIGIGNSEELGNMVFLDSDGSTLADAQGNKAARDIVQFVKFNDFKSQPIEKLAEEVLKEIPNQMTGFCQMKQIVPQQPVPNGVPAPTPAIAIIKK